MQPHESHLQLLELIDSLCEVFTEDNHLLFLGILRSYLPVRQELQVDLYKGEATPSGVIYHTPVKVQFHAEVSGSIPIAYAYVLRCSPLFWRLELARFTLHPNQRQSFRQRVATDGFISLDQQEESHPCRLMDISTSGVRFSCAQLFQLGEKLSLFIPQLYSGSASYTLSCVVRRSQEPTDAFQPYIYGCAFTSISRHEEDRLFHDLFFLQAYSANRQFEQSK